jgi:hypothetical protein
MNVEMSRAAISPLAHGKKPRTFVGLWRLPAESMTAIPRLPPGTPYEAAIKFATNANNVRQVNQQLSECIKIRFQPEGDVIIHGMTVNRPGLPTVSRDPNQQNRFVGLHFDSWDQLPFAERHRSMYRISVNVGQTPRYFLFCEIDVLEMRDRLLTKFSPESLAGRGVQEKFLRFFPEFPVTRLRVDPGFAYIAQTDMIIHDGSTFGTEGTSIHFTARGRFRFGFPSVPC